MMTIIEIRSFVTPMCSVLLQRATVVATTTFEYSRLRRYASIMQRLSRILALCGSRFMQVINLDVASYTAIV
jgi:hypothetical protein